MKKVAAIMKEYTYVLTFDRKCPDGEWRIMKGDFLEGEVVLRHPYNPDQNDGVPPAEIRARYEEVVGRPEFIPYDESSPVNVVEMMADEDDCAWDQPCAFGYRVEQHAVYCHNEKWLYAPRKCRRGKDWPHAECRGFRPNPTRWSPT